MEIEMGEQHRIDRQRLREAFWQDRDLTSYLPEPGSHRASVPDLFHLRVTGHVTDEMLKILTPEALLFIEELELEFGERRRELLQSRRERLRRITLNGERLDFLPQTAQIRAGSWKVAAAPDDLLDRRVEITGPADAKTIINGLNSGAQVFMADLEDAMSPTWENIVMAQVHLKDAVRRSLHHRSTDGIEYRLRDKGATLVVRPRGLHMEEKHLKFDGESVSASFFDFALYFFHNAHELLSRGSGPYFYLPKIESHLEAKLWNDVFNFSQDRLGIARGSIRATILVETVFACFEMDEILYELREHAAGLNAGRWDYLFSMLKTFASSSEVVFPDRAFLTMNAPFMRAYTRLLVATCHNRGAHAIGGMSAFVPSRKEPMINAMAFERVREDKEREARDGFDGTWVAHPDLVPVAAEAFASQIGDKKNQIARLVEEGLRVTARDLLPSPIEGGRITEAGVHNNISVAIQYLSQWLQGRGAVALNNLMEDTATAEIARAELWQWVKVGALIEGGSRLTRDEFRRRLEAERACFAGRAERGRVHEACDLLEKLVLAEDFPEFLTLPAYEILEVNA